MRNEPKVFRSLAEAVGAFGPCAVAIGNFDGVHVGHQALIRSAVEYADANGFVPAVLTFYPHPASVVAPERNPLLVCSLDERLRLLAEAGARHIFVLQFTAEIARLTPEEFVWKFLVNCLQAQAVFVGDGFRFGCKQAGNAATLRELGARLGFVPHFLAPVAVRGEVVSSSAVRQRLVGGQVARAGRLLGRCFSVSGPVVSGQGIGSKQTVPTLNLRPEPGQVLPRGVFVTETRELGSSRRWPSITNVGVRPTFGGEDVVIETFLLVPLEGATPERIEVEFRRFVRPERTFASPEELKAQILRDAARAQSYWWRAARLSTIEC